MLDLRLKLARRAPLAKATWQPEIDSQSTPVLVSRSTWKPCSRNAKDGGSALRHRRQAVLYASVIAKTYAPDIELSGVAAAAPATDLGALMRADIVTREARTYSP
jgi:hypothetical protein